MINWIFFLSSSNELDLDADLKKEILEKGERIKAELAIKDLDKDRRRELQQQLADLEKEYLQLQNDTTYHIY